MAVCASPMNIIIHTYIESETHIYLYLYIYCDGGSGQTLADIWIPNVLCNISEKYWTGTRTCKGESIAFRTNVSGKNHKDLDSFGGTTVN